MTDQYFSEQPTSASDPVSFRLEVGDVALDLTTDSGVFSRGRLDKGTRVLLANAPEPAGTGDLLDLGCGYGPIALWLAVRRPSSTVWAVDVNDRALDLVRANAAAAKVTNVRACRPDEIPADHRFAEMWSNPPIRSGKAALHELLLRWLPRVDGSSYLVVSKNLGSDSLARWLGEQGHPATRLSSHAGFRVLAVKRSESAA
ncbi:MFS transporter [Actinomycetospora sp. NBRC 106375]|uniref:class I SAM-dependent methyltransferase n=1 Tax=Actinomycetospora sp. NBRC 106375 TaxID=3032207 RepID=UPI0024A14856|nr:methyltransferase [Actinomycetospora sp. NBRC 106375]GLZ47664.1 MFS transporter [Actinomycetospora sp. NBRC 106375]